jgi:1-carboxybiuret hydrolase
MSVEFSSAAGIAAAVSARRVSAREVIRAALDRIAYRDRSVNAFSEVCEARALMRAAIIDEAIAAGRPAGPLAGVPFAVKNLFDLKGVRTLAGSKINAADSPPTADATLVQRLERAGAICVGALHMGEYAYDFTGENAHYGPVRNPHDVQRMSGGSSSGSGAAVAAGLVPIALGSDTNGSIRVPASLCGTFGLKPTYGRLSRAGTFPFVGSLDHLGPLARSVADLTLAYDAMQGTDAADPVMVAQPIEAALPTLRDGVAGLRVAVAGDYFENGLEADARTAVAAVAASCGAARRVVLPEARRARAAAFLITAIEGGSLHLGRLRTRAADFDPDTRGRLIAGALAPAAWYAQAQKFRRWFHRAVIQVFREVDVIIAPATPCVAPLIGQKTMMLNGVEVPVRPNLGLYTQPISFIGLPAVAVPVMRAGKLPIGVQIIGAPWQEAALLRVAAALEAKGVVAAPAAAAPHGLSTAPPLRG